MSIRTIISALLTAAAFGAAAGCGTDEKAERENARAAHQARDDREDRERERKEAAEKAAEQEKAREAAAACDSQFGELVDALGELNSRLDIGLSYDEYTDGVADVKVVYDQIDFESGGTEALDCISGVGLPAEKALNGYAKAAGTWGDCFDDFDCDTASIEPDLQGRWATAGRQVDRSRSALKRMQREAEA